VPFVGLNDYSVKFYMGREHAQDWGSTVSDYRDTRLCKLRVRSNASIKN